MAPVHLCNSSATDSGSSVLIFFQVNGKEAVYSPFAFTKEAALSIMVLQIQTVIQ